MPWEPESERNAILAKRLDLCAETISKAWTALGYRSSDVPGLSLAEAITKQLAELKPAHDPDQWAKQTSGE